MGTALVFSSPVAALLAYFVFLRKFGFSLAMFVFAIVLTPFLTLFAATVIEHITETSRYSALAGFVGGPVLLGIVLPLVEKEQLKKRWPSLQPLWAYGAVIFGCGCLILLGIFLRKP